MALQKPMLGIFLLIALCCKFGYGDYFCLMPSHFHPGLPFNIAFTVQKVTNTNFQAVTFQMTMVLRSQKLGDKPVISKSVEVTKGETKMLSLQIPEILPEVEEKDIFMFLLKGSGGLTVNHEHPVNMDRNQSIIMVQSDKNIYKPGQVVEFRVINVNRQLQPMFQPLSVVIVNPSDSKLERFDQLESQTGVIAKNFTLSRYASLGRWQIQVMDKDMEVLYSSPFLVEEFVLPKFSVDLKFNPDFLIWNVYNLPPAIIVKSVYTYGKAVQGECRLKLSRGGSKMNQILSKKISDTGVVEFTDEIEWSRLVGSKPSTSKMLLAQVEVLDETGRKEETSATINVYRTAMKVEILPSSTKILRAGLPAEFHIQVSNRYGNLVENEAVQIRIVWDHYAGLKKEIDVIRTQEKDQAFINFAMTVPYNITNMDHFNTFLRIEAILLSDREVTDTKELRLYKSKGRGAVQIKQVGDREIRKGQAVEYIVESSVSMTSDMTLSYVVVSQGNILECDNVRGMKISIVPTIQMCPETYLVVNLIQPMDKKFEVVSDSVSFSPSHCIGKEVSVSFSAEEARVGSDVTMAIQVGRVDGSNQMAGVHDVYYMGVDKSIVLLQGSTDLNENKVLDTLGLLNKYEEVEVKSVYTAGMIFQHLALDNVGPVTVHEEEEVFWAEVQFDRPVMAMAEAGSPVAKSPPGFGHRGYCYNPRGVGHLA